MQTIVLNWQPTTFSGWGVFGLNLAYWMVRSGAARPVFLAPVDPRAIMLDPAEDAVLAPLLAEAEGYAELLRTEGELRCDPPVLAATSLDFMSPPVFSNTATHCITFDESGRVSPAGLERSRRFATVVAGASWLGESLTAAGVANVRVVLQGINPTRFHPGVRAAQNPDRFVVFSGGKGEFRKGQDIVVAAFRIFRQRHPEAQLWFNWTSVYPELSATLAEGGLVGTPPPFVPGNQDAIAHWLVACGLPAGSFVNLDLIPNRDLPRVLGAADLAVFPNRCEGGTNLVAMEAMACGVPAVLSANTGHLDLIEADNCFVLKSQGAVPWVPPGHSAAHWGESSVEELLAAMEAAYLDRDEARRRGLNGAATLARLTWEQQTAALLRAVGLR